MLLSCMYLYFYLVDVICCLCILLFCFVFIVLSFAAATPSPSFDLLHPLKEGEGVEEQVVCLPASECDLELYTPELLYRHRPIEAPVSPRVKCTEK